MFSAEHECVTCNWLNWSLLSADCVVTLGKLVCHVACEYLNRRKSRCENKHIENIV